MEPSPEQGEYTVFATMYNSLQNQHSQTFDTKVFAEHVVYKGQQLTITNQHTYELLHKNLNSLEQKSTQIDMSTQPASSMVQTNTLISGGMPTIVEVSNFGSSGAEELTHTQQVNQAVWQPWWKRQIELSEQFL
jgi:hypothetical protein